MTPRPDMPKMTESWKCVVHVATTACGTNQHMATMLFFSWTYGSLRKDCSCLREMQGSGNNCFFAIICRVCLKSFLKC